LTEKSSASSSIENDGSAISVAPTVKLSARGFLIALACMAAFGLSIFSLFPDSVGGPPLPVKVVVEKTMVETVGGMGKMPTDCVIVTNISNGPIAHLVVVINGLYRLDRQAPIAPNESLTMPLSIFTDKRSSRRFDPTTYEVTKVVCNGQLPKGTRGVSVFWMKDLKNQNQ
jgi:hypothetical protein